MAFTRSVVNLELVFHYEFLATPSIPQFVLLDDELHGDYAASREEMVACVERLKLGNARIRNVVCRIQGEMEYAGALCTLMDFQYQPDNHQVNAGTQDNNRATPDSAILDGEISIKGDEVAYHLCSEAAQILSDALWDYVQDRPDIAARFEEAHAQMQTESASEPENEA